MSRVCLYDDSIQPMKQTSYDSAKNEYLTDCTAEVINFDLYIDQFFKKFSDKTKVTQSVDCVCIIDDEWYLIEFKNGSYDRKQIVSKISNSLLVLMRNENFSIKDAISKVNFILVNNSSHSNRQFIQQTVTSNANGRIIYSNLEQFQGSYFQKVYTMRKDEIEKFIKSKEIRLPN